MNQYYSRTYYFAQSAPMLSTQQDCCPRSQNDSNTTATHITSTLEQIWLTCNHILQFHTASSHTTLKCSYSFEVSRQAVRSMLFNLTAVLRLNNHGGHTWWDLQRPKRCQFFYSGHKMRWQWKCDDNVPNVLTSCKPSTLQLSDNSIFERSSRSCLKGA